MQKIKHLAIVLALLLLYSFLPYEEYIAQCYKGQKMIKHHIKASGETTPLSTAVNEDAADDPAIWINPSDASKSLIVGTDKTKGIGVYNLNGELINFYEVGEINNIDIRNGFKFGEQTIDLVACSNTSTNSIDIFKINADGTLTPLAQNRILSSVSRVYGFCMYYNSHNNGFYAFVNSKYAEIEQWHLQYNSTLNNISGELICSFNLGTQTEGMVADDENHTLFIGQEPLGIKSFDISNHCIDTTGSFLLESDTKHPLISSDIEGLALYKTNKNKGHLLASSQGNFSYAVFDRLPPHAYLGSFYISGTDSVDGVEETDGIEITSINLGSNYPKGMMVAQDGINYDGDTKQPQNFKYIDWRDIEKVIKK